MTENQKRFARALAEFLVQDAASKSIQLEMGKPSALEWAALRQATPLFGYPTVDEAEKTLTAFLFGGKTEKPAKKKRTVR